jgi:hypothetical protein
MSELSNEEHDLGTYSKSRVSIAKLLCKVFLVQLPILSKHEDVFIEVNHSVFLSLSKFALIDRDHLSSLVSSNF